MSVAEVIYFFCAATSLVAAWLLLRQYRRRRSPLLFWSSIGFLGLSVNNVFVFIDLGLLPAADLALPRIIVGATAMLLIVFGLIWEADS
jgi:hypothetical protein